jgi:hypothetical protein
MIATSANLKIDDTILFLFFKTLLCTSSHLCKKEAALKVPV